MGKGTGTTHGARDLLSSFYQNYITYKKELSQKFSTLFFHVFQCVDTQSVMFKSHIYICIEF